MAIKIVALFLKKLNWKIDLGSPKMLPNIILISAVNIPSFFGAKLNNGGHRVGPRSRENGHSEDR